MKPDQPSIICWYSFLKPLNPCYSCGVYTSLPNTDGLLLLRLNQRYKKKACQTVRTHVRLCVEEDRVPNAQRCSIGMCSLLFKNSVQKPLLSVPRTTPPKCNKLSQPRLLVNGEGRWMLKRYQAHLLIIGIPCAPTIPFGAQMLLNYSPQPFFRGMYQTGPLYSQRSPITPVLPPVKKKTHDV